MNLIYFFYGTPFWLWCSIFSLAILAITVLLTWVYSLKYFDSIRYAVEPASIVLSLNCTIFAVVLAMLTIKVVGTYDDAQKGLLLEADNTGNVFFMGMNLPEQQSKELTKLVKAYINYVITIELPAQDLNQKNIDQVKSQGYQYIQQMAKIVLNSKSLDVLKLQILNILESINSQRRIRIAATETGLPLFLWEICGLSWIILITNISLIKIKNIYSIYFFNISITFVITMITILLIDNHLPFTGGNKVNTMPFTRVLSDIKFFENKKNTSF